MKKRMGTLMDFEDERAHLICSFMWADIFWILEQTLCNLIEEAGRWDLHGMPEIHL